MLYTSYFAKMNKLPSNAIPVAISRTVPKGISCLTYKDLAPSSSLLKCYKTEGNDEAYTEYYNAKVLDRTTVKTVCNALYNLIPIDTQLRYDLDPEDWFLRDDIHVVLMCWEGADKFCHRKLVARWLTEQGVPCSEYTF